MAHRDIDDEIVSALDDTWLWDDIGGRFSCREIEAMAVVLSATVGERAGVRAIFGHALDPSEDCGDLHHGREKTRRRLLELGFTDVDAHLDEVSEWPACDCASEGSDDESPLDEVSANGETDGRPDATELSDAQ